MRLRVLLAAACTFALAAAAPGPAAGSHNVFHGCETLEPASVQPVGTADCDGARPGALLQVPQPEGGTGYCTMNYLFSGTDNELYIGTAGHCILSEEGETTWQAGGGPPAQNGAGETIGEFAYAVLNTEQEADFALIRLNAVGRSQANPQMCQFGGPTGINTSQPGLTEPVVLNHFGNGVLIGNLIVVDQETLAGRSALAAGMPSPNHVYAEGVVAPGDSGSGIQSSDGGAVGVIVTVGVHVGGAGTEGLDAGTVGAIRLGPMLSRATGATGVSYDLQEAPLL